MSPDEMLDHLREAARLLGPEPPITGEPWPTAEWLAAEWHIKQVELAMLISRVGEQLDERQQLANRVAGRPVVTIADPPAIAALRRHHGHGAIG